MVCIPHPHGLYAHDQDSKGGFLVCLWWGKSFQSRSTNAMPTLLLLPPPDILVEDVDSLVGHQLLVVTIAAAAGIVGWQVDQ